MAPASAAPPALPPSVEEAYRRKCIQLKQRTTEVEEANDAARLRLSRLKRQVEKMRLERAFLLEQLAKRTSTNVEDSDGSPSPPPTPKEKPLRIKRGHRKPSAFANLEAPSSQNAATPGSTFISQNLLVHSPGSDTPSAAQQGGGGDGAPSNKTNGVHKGGPPKKPGDAFELFCDEAREKADKEGGDDDEDELARQWKELPDGERDEYQTRADRRLAAYEKEKDAYEKEKDAYDAAKAKAAAAAADDDNDDDDDDDDDDTGKTRSAEPERQDAEKAAAQEEEEEEEEDTPPQQEDVEMTNYDTDQETQGEKPEA